ncbi:MAG: S-methyl-5'-thioadenosine phosphorylase [Chloroflexi bacterium CFX4]|nr:S-methyl-5'-thioadenosine phosphorylase [Chloroflexi bacterium CFX4]MDL1923497.1 S-methyl-5'-thioadenosine phosphorylase [Chloroflexi bacterium CFX3]
METIRYAVIGGSGLYNMPELTDITTLDLETPFGKPSDLITIGSLDGVRVAFLPRHGRGHVHTPSEVPYRANLFALKMLGVTHVVAVSACGSLKEALAPGHIVVPDQLYDNTRLERGRSFFGNGLVVHVSVADPFCPDLSRLIVEGTRAAGATVHEGGTFVTIEGPRFSTRAESEVFRRMGFSIIGMTTSPEAFLAREAEMCYAVMAHVTDYDVWHHSEEAVSAELVFKQFHANIGMAQRAVRNVIGLLARSAVPCACQDALSDAIATARERVTPETLSRLAPLIGRYFSTAAR